MKGEGRPGSQARRNGSVHGGLLEAGRWFGRRVLNKPRGEEGFRSTAKFGRVYAWSVTTDVAEVLDRDMER